VQAPPPRTSEAELVERFLELLHNVLRQCEWQC
jgi:hypothetical protein